MTRKRHMFIYIIMLAICIVAMPGCDGGFEREYSVLDDVIIGRVQKPDGLRKSSSTLPGYFSIDRNTGQVTSGLSRDELDTHLRDQYRTQLIDSFTQIR